MLLKSEVNKVPLMALIVSVIAPTPDVIPNQGRPLRGMLRPLHEIRVWRFSLYYTVVFGVYVALSVWLPKYYVDVYDLPLKKAALMCVPYIFASSLLRPLGGLLSDRFGPRKLTYTVFIVGAIACGALSFPQGMWPFFWLTLLLGITQGFGKASTIKYIPDYYPRDVGTVVGLVGALAALGGFGLPPLFAALKSATGQPQSLFWALLALTLVSLTWLHAVVVHIHRDEEHVI